MIESGVSEECREARSTGACVLLLFSEIWSDIKDARQRKLKKIISIFHSQTSEQAEYSTVMRALSIFEGLFFITS
jgi:hypothetical protein